MTDELPLLIAIGFPCEVKPETAFVRVGFAGVGTSVLRDVVALGASIRIAIPPVIASSDPRLRLHRFPSGPRIMRVLFGGSTDGFSFSEASVLVVSVHVRLLQSFDVWMEILITSRARARWSALHTQDASGRPAAGEDDTNHRACLDHVAVPESNKVLVARRYYTKVSADAPTSTEFGTKFLRDSWKVGWSAGNRRSILAPSADLSVRNWSSRVCTARSAGPLD